MNIFIYFYKSLFIFYLNILIKIKSGCCAQKTIKINTKRENEWWRWLVRRIHNEHNYDTIKYWDLADTWSFGNVKKYIYDYDAIEILYISSYNF